MNAYIFSVMYVAAQMGWWCGQMMLTCTHMHMFVSVGGGEADLFSWF